MGNCKSIVEHFTRIIMAYLSKQTIVKALKYVRETDVKVSAPCLSAIQYFIALDRFYHQRENKKQEQKAPIGELTDDEVEFPFLNGSSKSEKKEFISYVSDVISLDDGCYLKTFKDLYEGDKTISSTIQSNFFGGSSVDISKKSPDKVAYPQQGSWPLFYAFQGGVYRDEDYFSNLTFYLTTQEAKFAIAIWLLRKCDIGELSIETLRLKLAQTYTQLLVDTLIPQTELQYNDVKDLFELSMSQEMATITKGDLFPANSGNKVDYVQKIFFGTPGSGKSWAIKKEYEMTKKGNEYIKDEEKTKRAIRTTFHPDTDYAQFVGCYKPKAYGDDTEKKISYEFTPQAFTEAYVKAWSDLKHPYYLIIEEINRGNCAQIFGDLFQLLDRNKAGYSEYPIKADHDLREYLEQHLPEDSEGIMEGKLCLPPNLSIIASMNTSDQSLFPMDSAFKRRWSWEYVPIDYDNEVSAKFEINIGGEPVNWHEFLKDVNEKIKKVTSSEDKQMSNFFIKQSIDEKEFCDKVMFYLWSEVGKDNYQTNDAIFKYYTEDDKLQEFSFNELYDKEKRAAILKGFIRYIKKSEA